MKSVLMAFAMVLTSSLALADALPVKAMPAFPLRGPSADQPEALHRAHELFKCWMGAAKTVTPEYVQNQLTGLTVHLEDPVCAPQGLDLVFKTEQTVNNLKVLNLASPALETTALSAYKNAYLSLSVQDYSFGFKTSSSTLSQLPLIQYRVVFGHAYSYDPDQYGQFGGEFVTAAHWERTAIKLINKNTRTEQGCDPRFPKMECEYTTSVYSATYQNTLTGQSFDTTITEVESRP